MTGAFDFGQTMAVYGSEIRLEAKENESPNTVQLEYSGRITFPRLSGNVRWRTTS